MMFKKHHLENGIPVVMERMRNFRSVTLGIWVSAGSRYEQPEENGISHFLEHMFFKGTKKRSARDIAVAIDSIGGELNAFTSKEGTAFYIKVLDEHLGKGIELLTDIFLNSRFPEEEIRRESGVVTEEIKMVEDTPEDYIHDLFCRTVWGNRGLGQAVLGRKETVRTFTRGDLLGHIRKYYGTRDTTISCAGNFDDKALVDALDSGLGGLRRGSEPEAGDTPVFRNKVTVSTRDLSEAHLCLGIRGIHQSSPDRYCMLILNTILGGGISSRLFQEIREKRGLAYSVYSFLSSYQDTGLWAVYAGTGKKKLNEVVEKILAGLLGLHESLTEEDLQRAKDQIKGNIVLGLESTSRRMQNIATQQIYYGKYYSPRDVMRRIDSVSIKRARDVAEGLIKGEGVALAILGPVEKSELNISLPSD
jgi:predicted Zn-dependent peptidase